MDSLDIAPTANRPDDGFLLEAARSGFFVGVLPCGCSGCSLRNISMQAISISDVDAQLRKLSEDKLRRVYQLAALLADDEDETEAFLTMLASEDGFGRTGTLSRRMRRGLIYEG